MKLKAIHIAGVLALSAIVHSCVEDDLDDPIEITHDTTPYVLNTRDITPPTIAADNQLTVQTVELGRMLFHDTKLSGDNTQSCSSCHVQANGFSDTARLSIGINGFPGKRQAMASFNMAWNTNEFFWDGRAHLLRDQSLLPIQDSLEMHQNLDDLVIELQGEKDYQDQFIRAFGDDTITSERISLALEQFMNSIISVNSKYDQYKRGEVQLTASEERGRRLFFAEFNPSFPDSSGADCQHCHAGRNFENDMYMNNALDADGEYIDLGRELVSNNPNDRGKFKVPTLRNVELTPPYMHDGRFKTLREVVEHYNTGMKSSSTVDPILIYPIQEGGFQLSDQDIDDLVAFLKTLTDYDMVNNSEYASPF